MWTAQVTVTTIPPLIGIKKKEIKCIDFSSGSNTKLACVNKPKCMNDGANKWEKHSINE